MTLERLPVGQGETILVVDDESVTRMMVRKVLEESQYRVLEAEDGTQALEIVRQTIPDLILLDVRMPRMNGFDTCHALRELEDGRHLPILMLTGLDDVVSVQLAFESGATDFITKPINWALLAQRLRYALRSKQQEERLRESESRLAHAQQLARLGQWHYYQERRTFSLSEGLAEHLGFEVGSHEFSIPEIMQRVFHRDRYSLYRLMLQVYRTGISRELEFRLIGPGGGLCTVHLYAELVKEGDGLTLRGTLQDVSARIEAEARISYFSHYDRLTELPNRVLFWDRLTQSIAESKRSGTPFAVLLVDLDRFSALNASVGHVTGDRVLCKLAQRMKESLRASDTLSRIGGDEFAIIYHDMEKERDLSYALARLMDCFEAPVVSNGLDVYVSVSVGIAIYPDDGADLDNLLMHADVAKGRAKQSPGSNYQFYTAAMGKTARDRIAMELALRRGLEDQAFVLHYQPLLSLSNSEVWGVEVLLRWQHPELGLVLPDSFIPILGEIGLLQEVGEWILRQACEQTKDFDFMVSVNLSPVQFIQTDLVERISSSLQQTAFPPRRLQLEITENVFIEDSQQAKLTLEALRALGIKVAIDDFGTGFSSLAYLKQFTTDFLKIDRSFINELESDGANLAIVNSTIKLGHDLGMRIIGEGVENVAALQSLTRMGCDVAQGFFIARPMNLEQLGSWLAER